MADDSAARIRSTVVSEELFEVALQLVELSTLGELLFSFPLGAINRVLGSFSDAPALSQVLVGADELLLEVTAAADELSELPVGVCKALVDPLGDDEGTEA